jgi:DegV family protein with EDD domain
MAVRIVTDSTADIPAAQAEALGITVVPLTVFFGDEAYLDGVELDNESFYRKLQASKTLPRTSQPSPAAFQEAYTRLIEEGAEGILSIHLSAKLSGTYQSARTAAESLPDDLKKVLIEVVDSESVSAGMGGTVIKVAEEARQGVSLEELKDRALNRFARTHILAVLDTLEYVWRGGRIGRAEAFLGNMLSFKPVIAIKEGEVVPVERPRTRGKAYTRIAQLVSELGPTESLAVVESSEEVGTQLADALKAIYQGEIPRYKLGAVLGSHTGPGTVGAIVVTAR